MVKITEWDSSKYLKTEEDIKEYLNAAIEGGDLEHFKFALSQVAKAKGMTNISKVSGVPRATLYKSLEKNRSPEFKTIQSILDSLDLQIMFTSKCKYTL